MLFKQELRASLDSKEDEYKKNKINNIATVVSQHLECKTVTLLSFQPPLTLILYNKS